MAVVSASYDVWVRSNLHLKLEKGLKMAIFGHFELARAAEPCIGSTWVGHHVIEEISVQILTKFQVHRIKTVVARAI